MNIQVFAGTLSGLLAVATLLPYLRDIFYGQTRPSIISQSLWCIFALITVAGQFAADGFSWSMAVALATAFNNIIIVAVCLFGYGYKGHTSFDVVSGLVALAGIVLWKVTTIPEYGIVFAVAASVCAGIPTYRKTFRFPKSESTIAWLLVLAAAICAFVALKDISVATLAYPTFAFLEAVLVVTLTLRPTIQNRASEKVS